MRSEPLSVEALLAEAREALAASPLGRGPFAPPRREAALLLGRLLGRSEASLLARGEERVPAETAARFREWIERRGRGEPVAYLLGEREFYGRSFRVDGRVLIPRPETEHLIEAALAWLLPPSPPARPPGRQRILDVGTGSGAIAVTLAAELPAARIVATDLSPAALEVARSNARRHGVDGRIRFAASDLTSALRLGAFDLVVSNPPYIAREEAGEISSEVLDHEPHGALFAAEEGLAAVRALFEAAGAEKGLRPAKPGLGLRPGAGLLIEIGHRHESGVRALAAGSSLELLEIRRDYAGKPRLAVAKKR